MIIHYENKTGKEYIRMGHLIGVKAHFHKHIEMICSYDCEAELIVDGQHQKLERGDFFVAFPNQVHEIKDLKEGKNAVIIFDPDICPEYKDLLVDHVPEKNVIKGNSAIAEHILSLYDEYTDPSYRDVSKAIYRGYILVLVGLMLKHLKLKMKKSPELDATHSVISYCMNNYKNKITLDNMANDLHLSKYYISRIFSQNLSMSMTEYVNGLRISYAERLLQEGKQDITHIAYECGFENIRSFNRAFCRVNGVSPSRWRKSIKEK